MVKNNETIIEIKELEFAYEDSEEVQEAVLKGVSLEVKKGEFLAVLGHNGSGNRPWQNT